MNGTLYNLVNALLDPAVVLVVFVALYTDSNFLLGLTGVARPAAWLLPQLWMSGIVQNSQRAMPIYRYSALVRGFLMLALVIAVFTVQDGNLLLLIFFVLVIGEQLAAGVAGLPFLDVVGKVIPANRRGLFFAWRLGLGGLLAIGGGVVVRALLDEASPLGTPANFGVIFAMATFFAILALLAWIVVVDEPAIAPRSPRRGLLQQLRRARRAWRQDDNYRAYLQARISLFFVVSVATPFVTVYARRAFAVPVETVATYLAITAAARLMGTVAAGWISARWGNQHLIRLGAAIGMLALVMVVAAMPLRLESLAAGLYFGLVFVLMALRDAMVNTSLAALNINVAPEEQRPLYVGFSTTVVGIAMLAGSTMGILVDVIGFELFFVLMLGLMGYGVWQVRQLQDPSV